MIEFENIPRIMFKDWGKEWTSFREELGSSRKK
jgi:hypothetical protein